MATARSALLAPTESRVLHCISRCVRRSFLCGRDSYTGASYEHRRGWIRERLHQLSEVFSVEIYSYAIMSNHLHVVVRTLPDTVPSWSDEQVARRWLQIFPGKRILARRSEPPTALEIQTLCLDREKLAKVRIRLADISWFMRSLNEPIARRANQEDQCTGRFWEGRFKCQNLDDEGGVLSCMAYVDLNPVRAGMADTPEQSDFTSVQDRATAHKARQQLAHAPHPQEPTPEQVALIRTAKTDARRDQWLAPIGLLDEHRPPQSNPPVDTNGNQPDHDSSGGTAPLFANVSLDDYLELLDWTGRQIRSDKRGHIAPELRPVLERLDLDVEAWVTNVEAYSGLFHRVVGKIHRLGEIARATGRSWLQGQRGARQLYADTGVT